jgi:hypothetical protein
MAATRRVVAILTADVAAYLDDGDNYPIVPITPIADRDRGHDRDDC